LQRYPLASDSGVLGVVSGSFDCAGANTSEKGSRTHNMDRRTFVKLGSSLVSGLTQSVGFESSSKAAEDEVAGGGQISHSSLQLKGNQLHFAAQWCEIPDWDMAIEVNDELHHISAATAKLISADPLHVEFSFPQSKLTWEVHGEIGRKTDSVILRSTIHNNSSSPVALGKAFLLQTDQLGGFFSVGDDVVYLPISSGQRLNQVEKLGSTPAEQTADALRAAAIGKIGIQSFNQTQDKALQVGFVTFARAKTQVEQIRRTSTLQLKAWSEFDGWDLQPGASTITEDLILQAGRNPHRQLENWGDQAALRLHPAARKWEELPHGWVGWPWVDMFYVERQEDVVLRNAKAIQERLAGFGIDYIWVSIGNLKNGLPGNWLQWNYRNFPNGPAYLHEQIEDLGFKWGLWCGIFMLSSRIQDRMAQLGDAVFVNPDGKTPLEYLYQWEYGVDSFNDDFKHPIYALDPSHPKTQEFIREVFTTYRDWGVRYYMIDFLGAAGDTLTDLPHAKHYDKSLVSGPEVFRTGLQAIRDACGDDTHLLAATGPTTYGAGIMDAVRTGTDFCEGRPIFPGLDMYPATYAINSPEDWNGPVKTLSNQAATYFTHRKLYINNSGNNLTVDKPITWNQAQVFATIHAMSGGPAMLGDDISIIEDDRLKLIKQTLPRPKDVAFPVDLFTRKEKGYPRVFHRKVVKPWGSYDVVAIYNLEQGKTLNQTVDLPSIELDSSRCHLVWEFWNSEFVGKIRGQLQAQVPAYSVKVFRLTEDLAQPTLVGTDLHLLMGEMEIDRYEWDASEQVLSGRAIRPIGETGSVFLYAPPKTAVANPKGYYIAQDKRDLSLVIRCPMEFKKGWAEWKVKFVAI
jgi:hypothetical protein